MFSPFLYDMQSGIMQTLYRYDTITDTYTLYPILTGFSIGIINK